MSAVLWCAARENCRKRPSVSPQASSNSSAGVRMRMPSRASSLSRPFFEIEVEPQRSGEALNKDLQPTTVIADMANGTLSAPPPANQSEA